MADKGKKMPLQDFQGGSWADEQPEAPAPAAPAAPAQAYRRRRDDEGEGYAQPGKETAPRLREDQFPALGSKPAPRKPGDPPAAPAAGSERREGEDRPRDDARGGGFGRDEAPRSGGYGFRDRDSGFGHDREERGGYGGYGRDRDRDDHGGFGGYGHDRDRDFGHHSSGDYHPRFSSDQRPDGDHSSYDRHDDGPRESHEPVPLPDKPPFRVVVLNLDYHVDERELGEFFEKTCQIKNVVIPLGPDNRSRGFGKIEFPDLENLKEALKFDGRQMAGRSIHVDCERPRHDDVDDHPGDWRAGRPSLAEAPRAAAPAGPRHYERRDVAPAPSGGAPLDPRVRVVKKVARTNPFGDAKPINAPLTDAVATSAVPEAAVIPPRAPRSPQSGSGSAPRSPQLPVATSQAAALPSAAPPAAAPAPAAAAPAPAAAAPAPAPSAAAPVAAAAPAPAAPAAAPASSRSDAEWRRGAPASRPAPAPAAPRAAPAPVAAAPKKPANPFDALADQEEAAAAAAPAPAKPAAAAAPKAAAAPAAKPAAAPAPAAAEEQVDEIVEEEVVEEVVEEEPKH